MWNVTEVDTNMAVKTSSHPCNCMLLTIQKQRHFLIALHLWLTLTNRMQHKWHHMFLSLCLSSLPTSIFNSGIKPPCKEVWARLWNNKTVWEKNLSYPNEGSGFSNSWQVHTHSRGGHYHSLVKLCTKFFTRIVFYSSHNIILKYFIIPTTWQA